MFLGSFVENLKRSDRPSTGTLKITAKVIAAAFYVIVPGITNEPATIRILF